ncbi:MAG: hypothetical protein CG440_553 [Methanosaeta sp. NSM2]|nr:CooT family nickel-binding protein [Methanothrix sp.]OYV14528.1 MAG: hypothetical protein CG440_553 [Methanosaeta sp. NSM2]
MCELKVFILKGEEREKVMDGVVRITVQDGSVLLEGIFGESRGQAYKGGYNGPDGGCNCKLRAVSSPNRWCHKKIRVKVIKQIK